MTDTLGHMNVGIVALSRWIDTCPENARRDSEAGTWGRLAKVGEECGEVVAAFIGATGQNPRKGVTHTLSDVKRELLDVALTALAAYAHLNQNHGTPAHDLAVHLDLSLKRVGISAT